VLHALQRNPDQPLSTTAAFQADLNAPAAVPVTGRCDRLQPPRWRLSIQGTPCSRGC